MTAPTITKIILLEFALSLLKNFRWLFLQSQSLQLTLKNNSQMLSICLLSMVFVHVSRCLIFKVHRPCSLYKISAASSVALNRSDCYILARCFLFVKNFFRFFEKFFSQGRNQGPFRSAPAYNSTEYLICQHFFSKFLKIFL